MSGGGASSKPRIGVVLPQLGVSSHIWAVRQAMAFSRVEPVMLGWGWAPEARPLPEGLERRLFGVPYPPPVTRAVRLGWRLGLPGSVEPDARIRADIRATLAEARVDGVLCHFASTAIPVAAALAEGPSPRPPVSCLVHGRDATMFLANRAYRAALRRALPRLARVAVVASYQIDRLRPFGLDRAEIIPCGAPTARFAARPLPERAPGEPLRFISVCRLTHEKGVYETLDAFERVVAALGPDAPVEWTCIGDGPLEADFAVAVRASPAADRIRLPGYLGEAAVAEALSQSHVFVQHSRPVGGWHEGFSVSMTEAGAAGLPLVASTLGGNADQIEEGVTGFLFAPDDVATQAEAMLRQARDEDLRRRQGEAARQAALGWDADTLARRLEDLLLETLPAAPEAAAHG